MAQKVSVPVRKKLTERSLSVLNPNKGQDLMINKPRGTSIRTPRTNIGTFKIIIMVMGVFSSDRLKHVCNFHLLPCRLGRITNCTRGWM